MSEKKYVLGMFKDEGQTVAAIEALRGSKWKLQRVHSPYPAYRVMEVLKLKKSRVGYFTLAGGILGFFAGIGLAIFTATQWNVIVGGKPVIALIPFFIVGFEFTILFSVLGNVVGLLTQTGLPEFKSLEHYDVRCSGAYFGILTSFDEDEPDRLVTFFQERGGETRVFG